RARTNEPRTHRPSAGLHPPERRRAADRGEGQGLLRRRGAGRDARARGLLGEYPRQGLGRPLGRRSHAGAAADRLFAGPQRAKHADDHALLAQSERQRDHRLQGPGGCDARGGSARDEPPATHSQALARGDRGSPRGGRGAADLRRGLPLLHAQLRAALLIVAHEVTNHGSDRAQLSNMAGQAKAAMGVEALDVLADRGYFSGEEVLACEPLGVTPYVPKPLTSGSKAKGRFGKQDFVYVAEDDTYRCPAGETLTRRFTSVEDGMNLYVYGTDRCAGCALKSRCTSGKQRRIKRWEHEAVIDAMQDRLDRSPNAMRIRRATLEHAFGTLKAWMGATHFRTKTLEKVKTEMSLHVLAYNLKRVIAILGAQPLMQAMRA